jgi:FtsP/CotA-like multicopper oxidase with cupredoxin domain
VEWVVVLDDWVDGTGRTPDEILARFRAGGSAASSAGGMGGMGGMGGTGTSSGTSTGTSAGTAGTAGMGMGMGGGSIMYPYYLVNGRLPTAPVTFTARPGQRARIRIVNAGSDTAFRVALGGHTFTVTHADGYPVTPTTADALVMGMGERYDVQITLEDGVFPLVVLPEGKPGHALALVRTGSGSAPDGSVRPTELNRHVLLDTAIDPADSTLLPMRGPDRLHKLVLEGSMNPYHWTINGRSHPDTEPLPVSEGERVRIRIMNRSMMFHPWHVHGHTFALAATGLRKDTVVIRPMQVMNLELQADNPGLWMTHCHNLYHAESGMMTTLAYRR